ncbi:hypothetical protein ACF0H5_015095 [Mactra antiquata]
MSEQDLLREAIQSVDLMEFPTYYQQQPMYQPSQQTMIQPQPLIQPVQQTSGGSIQDKQIALAVLKELKEIKTLHYPLKDLCEMMAKKQQSCSVQFQAQEMEVSVRCMTHHGQGRHSKKMPEEPALKKKKEEKPSFQTSHWTSVASLDGYIATNGTETTTGSLIRCAKQCQKVLTCASFFYKFGQSSANCQFHGQIFVGTTGLVNNGYTKYYEIAGINDCDGWYQRGVSTSGVYNIYLINDAELSVWCDMSPDTGGWIVIQQRTSASDFYKTWEEYKEGFGDLNGNFWLGNENIWTLTSTGHWKLRVELTYGHESGYAEYDAFSIGDETTNYVLSVGTYSGDIGDSLSYHNGYQFSTYDRDNDVYGTSCAQLYHGAWWYNHCHYVNLNGDYGNNAFGMGLNWVSWKGHSVSVSTSKMTIKNIQN